MANWGRSWRRRLWQIKQLAWRFRVRNRADLIKLIAVLGFFGILAMTLLGVVVFAWYSRDLPQPDKIVRHEGFATKIYDRNGELLYDVFADQRRTPVELNQIPDYLKQGTIAVEDKHFYSHQGFDPWGWVRAVFNTVFRFKRLAGGSTLTQQLVKNVLLTPQRALSRKVKEFVLAVQIEKKYTKDEILKMYLNESPYGGTAWGVAAAAETYFGKEVADLNLVESAVLAGLPQSPTTYSPFGQNPDAYKDRTAAVLRRMAEDGYITKDQHQQALKDLETLTFANPDAGFKAPHFVMYVRQLLIDRYGERLVEQGGLKVTTTLDWKLQEQAQAAVTEEIAKVETLHITNGAAMVVNPQTGEILAMVGSKNYFDENYDGKVNVNLSQRQPGSAIKPVNYVTAFDKGYTAATEIADVETEFPGGASLPVYKPKNYDGKVRGPVQLRYALGNSLNIPAVKLLQLISVKDMLETANRMGFTTLEPTTENVNRFGLSLTLGGGEIRLIDMASAYSAFANGGLKVEPVSILKVEDQTGKVLEEFKPNPGNRVISPAEAFLISHILADNNARLITFGANSLLNIPGHNVAVKTGTTNDQRDNWAVGWTPEVLVGAWVGNNDNTPMKTVASGVSGATPIWRRIIVAALTGKAAQPWLPPSDIVQLDVDQISGYPAHDGYPSRQEYFINGTQPNVADPIHTKLKVCRGQDKLATNTMVATGDYEEKEYIVLKEQDPGGDSRNRWQEGIDAWIAGQADSRYHNPRDYCDSTSAVVVEISEPSDHQQINSNDVTVKAKITANKNLAKVEVFADGTSKKTWTSKPYEVTINLSDGTHTIKVRAEDESGNVGEREIKIGVNKPWDWSPSPASTISAQPAWPYIAWLN